MLAANEILPAGFRNLQGVLSLMECASDTTKYIWPNRMHLLKWRFFLGLDLLAAYFLLRREQSDFIFDLLRLNVLPRGFPV